jgi:hypothetical protein
MKKGQIMGLPLVLIFGLIVASLLLFFGIKFIINLQDEANYVDFLGSLDDLEGNIETFAHYDAGSAKVYQLNLPSAVEQLCFYGDDLAFVCNLNGQGCPRELQEYMQLVKEPQSNVYVYPTGVFDRSRFLLAPFQTEGANPVCVSNGQSVVIKKFEDYVGIEYYES